MMDAAVDRCAYSGGLSRGVEIVELELFTPAATFGAHLLIALWPAARTAWFWAGIVEAGEAVVSVVEQEIPLPRPAAGFELRASGLGAEAVCEAPFEHWSYGLEAFALRYDDPTDAVTHQRGERVPLGYELEWEADASPPVGAIEVGRQGERDYRQGGIVHGEVLVGSAVYDVSGFGSRLHRVGPGVPAEDAGTLWRNGVGSWCYRDDEAGDCATGRSLARLTPPTGLGPPLLAERTLWRGEDGAAGWSRVARADATTLPG